MGDAALRAITGGLVATLVCAWGCGAGAVSHNRAQALDRLYQRSLDLAEELTKTVGAGVAQLNASGDAQSLDCLETLRDAASETSDQLLDVRDVAALAAGLTLKADRRAGTAATRRSAAQALSVLPAEARQVSRTADLCRSQADVQQRAKAELALIDDATAALTQLTGGR
ncbi:MAG TPA: hypothetical protein VN805_02670 [Caulobacteraceae bacterium]|nr:hypothetical protein [Caulobacteraceae bacterium]